MAKIFYASYRGCFLVLQQPPTPRKFLPIEIFLQKAFVTKYHAFGKDSNSEPKLEGTKS